MKDKQKALLIIVLLLLIVAVAYNFYMDSRLMDLMTENINLQHKIIMDYEQTH